MPAVPTVTEVEKVELSVLTSKPAVAITNIPACIAPPDTLKLDEADAVPCCVVNADNEPVVDMVVQVPVPLAAQMRQKKRWLRKAPATK
jgi:hypothetical protein